MDLLPKGLITWKFRGFFSDWDLRLMSGNSCVLCPDEQQCQLVYEFFFLRMVGNLYSFIYGQVKYIIVKWSFFFLSIQFMKRFTIGNYKTSYQLIF